jgi:hypothetical protein
MIMHQKDFMWYVKSTFEAILIFIFMVCLIGFVVSLFIPIWSKEIANIVMGLSVSIGVFNGFFLVAWDSRWRQDYRDPEDAETFD